MKKMYMWIEVVFNMISCLATIQSDDGLTWEYLVLKFWLPLMRSQNHTTAYWGWATGPYLWLFAASLSHETMIYEGFAENWHLFWQKQPITNHWFVCFRTTGLILNHSDHFMTAVFILRQWHLLSDQHKKDRFGLITWVTHFTVLQFIALLGRVHHGCKSGTTCRVS